MYCTLQKCLRHCDIRQGDADCNRDVIRIILCIVTLHWHFETSCTDSYIIPVTELSYRCSSSSIELVSKWLQLQEHPVFGSYKIIYVKTDISHISESIKLHQLKSFRVCVGTKDWWRGQVVHGPKSDLTVVSRISPSCLLVLGQILLFLLVIYQWRNTFPPLPPVFYTLGLLSLFLSAPLTIQFQYVLRARL